MDQIPGIMLEKQLGEGGFGVVWRGVESSGRPVAVKIAKKPSSTLSTQQLIWQQNEL